MPTTPSGLSEQEAEAITQQTTITLPAEGSLVRVGNDLYIQSGNTLYNYSYESLVPLDEQGNKDWQGKTIAYYKNLAMEQIIASVGGAENIPSLNEADFYGWAGGQLEKVNKQRLSIDQFIQKAGGTPTTPTPQSTPTPTSQPTPSPEDPMLAGVDTTGWTPEMKDLYKILKDQIEGLIQGGEMINPDIEIDEAITADFLKQAQTEIEPYYKSLSEQARGDLMRQYQFAQEERQDALTDLQQQYEDRLDLLSESSAERGFAYSGIRKKDEGKLADATQRAIEGGRRRLLYQTTGIGTQYERQFGSKALQGLNIPSIGGRAPQVLAGQAAWSYGQTQAPLYTLSGNVVGALEREQQVAEQQRVSQLESAYRSTRALDFYGP